MLLTEFGDEIAMNYYGGINEAYETDYKRVKSAQQHCMQLCDELQNVSDDEIRNALPRAFSGRLECHNRDQFHYTPGQFYNIEVPQAVEAVLEYIKRNRKAK